MRSETEHEPRGRTQKRRQVRRLAGPGREKVIKATWRRLASTQNKEY
jgi:hypothetical protein